MAENAMELEIVTPERMLLREEVSEFVGPGWLGQFGVRPGHCSMVIALRGGVVSYTAVNGNTAKIAVGGGFAVVNADRSTILADVAEPAAEVDVARARADEAQARSALEGLGLDDPAYAANKAALDLAVARIEAAA